MPIVYLKLTKAQASKMRKGQGVRMSSSPSSGDLHPVEMDAAMFKRYNRAMLSGKGCIVNGSVGSAESSEEVEGGKINFKKLGRQIKKGINTTGVDIIEGTKKAIPKEVAKQIVQNGVAGSVLAGSAFLGMPNAELAAMAGKAAGVGVDAGYGTDFRDKKALKKFGKNYVAGAQDELMAQQMSGGKISLKKISRRVKKFANNQGSDFLEAVKKNSNRPELQDQLRRGAQAAVMKATNDEAMANRVGGYTDRVVDAAYNVDFKKKDALKKVGRQLEDVKDELKNDGLEYASNYITNAVNGGLLIDDGVPVSKAKFTKGSPEAKAYMAELRSRRKAKGGSLVKNQVHAIEGKLKGQGFVPLGGKGFVPLGGGFVPL